MKLAEVMFRGLQGSLREGIFIVEIGRIYKFQIKDTTGNAKVQRLSDF